MKCKYSIDDISNYKDNIISLEERLEIEAHLDECESCRNLYRVVSAVEAFAMKDIEPGSDFTRKVMNGLDHDRYKRNKVFLRGRSVMYQIGKRLKPVAAAAACCACILLLLWGIKTMGVFDTGRDSSLGYNTTSGTVSAEMKKVKAGWKFETYMKGLDKDSAVRYTDIFLIIDSDKQEVVNLGSFKGTAGEIKDYKSSGIPENAVMACKNVFDDKEDTFYLYQKNNNTLSIMGKTGDKSEFEEIREIKLPYDAEIETVEAQEIDRDEESKERVSGEDWFFVEPHLYYVKDKKVLGIEHEDIYEYRKLIKKDRQIPDGDRSDDYIKEKYLSGDKKYNNIYYVYSRDKYMGEHEGKLSYSWYYGEFYIDLQSLDKNTQDYFGISKKYDAIPRMVDREPEVKPEYRKAIKDYLLQKGLNVKDVTVIEAVSSDLDGDGNPEKLISCSNIRKARDYNGHMVNSGIYNLVALFNSKDELVNIMSESILNQENIKKINNGESTGKLWNMVFDIPYVIDINNDGTMEVAVRTEFCGTDAGHELKFFEYRNGKLE